MYEKFYFNIHTCGQTKEIFAVWPSLPSAEGQNWTGTSVVEQGAKINCKNIGGKQKNKNKINYFFKPVLFFSLISTLLMFTWLMCSTVRLLCSQHARSAKADKVHCSKHCLVAVTARLFPRNLKHHVTSHKEGSECLKARMKGTKLQFQVAYWHFIFFSITEML